MNTSFSARLIGALDVVVESVLRFLPGLLAALLVVAVGLVLGLVLRAIVKKTLTAARFDRLCDAIGLTHVLSRADVGGSPSEIAATLVFWLLFVSFGMAGLSALQVAVVNQLIAEFFLYLPRLLSALAIVLVGFLLGSFLARAALLAAVNAGVPSPRVTSLAVKFLITILSFAMALEQLQIARSIVLAAFVITFGAVMLSLAIAFGTGGKEVARRVLERQFTPPPEPPAHDDISHL